MTGIEPVLLSSLLGLPGIGQMTGATLMFNILKGTNSEVHIKSGAVSGAIAPPPSFVQVGQYEWTGLWYRHTNWYGRPDAKAAAARKRARLDEVADNKLYTHQLTNLRPGEEMPKLRLGSVWIAVPIKISYGIYKPDVEQIRGLIGERRRALVERQLKAESKVVKRRAELRAAGIPDDVAQVHLQPLEELVEDHRTALKEMEVAIDDLKNARQLQLDGVPIMANFRISHASEYGGYKNTIPSGVKVDGNFEVKYVDMAGENPHVEIDFTWHQSYLLGFGKPVTDTFKWYPDAGPEGTGTFVTRFMTGARRINDDWAGNVPEEEKSEYTPTTSPAGRKKRAHVPSPAAQKVKPMNQTEAIAMFSGATRSLDDEVDQTYEPRSNVPAENKIRPPGKIKWTSMLAEAELADPRALYTASRRARSGSEKVNFLRAVAKLNESWLEYWNSFKNLPGTPTITVVTQNLKEAYRRLDRNWAYVDTLQRRANRTNVAARNAAQNNANQQPPRHALDAAGLAEAERLAAFRNECAKYFTDFMAS